MMPKFLILLNTLQKEVDPENEGSIVVIIGEEPGQGHQGHAGPDHVPAHQKGAGAITMESVTGATGTVTMAITTEDGSLINM